MNKDNTKETKKKRRSSFKIDSLIAETVYNPETKNTLFATCNNAELIKMSEYVENDGQEIYPLDANSDVISKGIVLLPSKPEDYTNEQDLIQEIQNFIHKYLDISSKYEQIASYYVLCSWLYDRFNELPYLRAIGDFGSGKSRFLLTIGSICYRPIFTGGATTTAPIFRILDEIKGTLIMDEADLRVSDMTTDIIKILNMGYQKGGSVLRMGGRNMEDLKAFDVFSPKVIATRETFNDKALESRFLVEEMGRGKLRKNIPLRIGDEFYEEALTLRNKLLMWRFRNYNKKLDFNEAEIEGVHPRLRQIVIPLMTIINSEDMKSSLKEFVKSYNTELTADRGLSRESDILFAILKFEYDTKQKEVTVGEIAEYVNQDIFEFDDRITPRKIGWYLRAKMQLKPYKTRRGFVLDIERNRERINFWKERYGVRDEDIRGEEVNVGEHANVIEGTNEVELTASELGF